MKEFLDYQRSITRKSLITGILIILVGFAFGPPYGLGFLLGCAASLLVFQLKVRHYLRFASISKRKAHAFIMQKNLLRLVILAVILALAFYIQRESGRISGFCAAAGIFLTNAVIIVNEFTARKFLKARQ